MFRLLILPMLVLSGMVGFLARRRGRRALGWAGVALAVQVVLAAAIVAFSASERPDIGAETWVVALTVLSPLLGAAAAAALLWILPRRG